MENGKNRRTVKNASTRTWDVEPKQFINEGAEMDSGPFYAFLGGIHERMKDDAFRNESYRKLSVLYGKSLNDGDGETAVICAALLKMICKEEGRIGSERYHAEAILKIVANMFFR